MSNDIIVENACENYLTLLKGNLFRTNDLGNGIAMMENPKGYKIIKNQKNVSNQNMKQEREEKKEEINEENEMSGARFLANIMCKQGILYHTIYYYTYQNIKLWNQFSYIIYFLYTKHIWFLFFCFPLCLFCVKKQ